MMCQGVINYTSLCRIRCEVARKGSADLTEEVKGRLQGEGEEGSATLRMQPNVQVDWRQHRMWWGRVGRSHPGKGGNKMWPKEQKGDSIVGWGNLFVMMGVESVENTRDLFGGAGRGWIRHVKVLYWLVGQWGAVRVL